MRYPTLIPVLVLGSLAIAQSPNDFVTTWRTDLLWVNSTGPTQLTIPTFPTATYNYQVDWDNDGVFDEFGITGDVTHDFGVPGTYTIRISGLFPQIFFQGGTDAKKLLSVDQWGNNPWTSMNGAFLGCSALHINASDAPDLSNVTVMENMFRDCSVMNEPLDSWDVSTVVNMAKMFRNAYAFNQPLDSWDVSNVQLMFWMFLGAQAFNQPLGSWDVSNVQDMRTMFLNATAFDQDLGGWDISSLQLAQDMFDNSGLSTANYDSLLIGWATLDPGEAMIPSGTPFGASNVQFCAAAAARDTLIQGHGWVIADAGQGAGCDTTSFITTWQTDLVGPFTSGPTELTILTFPGETYAYDVDWNNDGVFDEFGITGDVTHDYGVTGIRTIRIRGTYPRSYFEEEAGDGPKLLSIDQWGTNPWTSMEWAFTECINLNNTTPVPDRPDLSGVTSMAGMFFYCPQFTGANLDIGNWDVSHVTDMSYLFSETAFDQPLSDWEVSQVKYFDAMFALSSFDQDMSGWNDRLDSSISMNQMFSGTVFNGDITGWDVSHVQQMNEMFANNPVFDQDLSLWDVGQVTNMGLMFWNATAFDQDIGGWDVSQVQSLLGMFWSATSFDQDLGDWDVSSLIGGCFNMFANAGMSTANYDSLLIGWATLDPGEAQIPSNMFLTGGNSMYCVGEAARNTLMGTYGWSFDDAGLDPGCGTAKLSAKVLLQGPYVQGASMMHDSLRSQGVIPTTEPYTALGYLQAGGGGGETVAPAVLAVTGNDAIVDWVYLQLRNGVDNTVVAATRCALLRRDGSVVDVDGTSPVTFAVPAGNYHVAVFHRNHLGILSLNPVALSYTPSLVDFIHTEPTYGTDAQVDVGGSKMLWAGDVTTDGLVKYTGLDNDRDPILTAIGGVVPTGTVAGYLEEDVNMDGTVKYTGLENDRDIILQNIGGVVPTNVRQEQMP